MSEKKAEGIVIYNERSKWGKIDDLPCAVYELWASVDGGEKVYCLARSFKDDEDVVYEDTYITKESIFDDGYDEFFRDAIAFDSEEIYPDEDGEVYIGVASSHCGDLRGSEYAGLGVLTRAKLHSFMKQGE